MERLGIDIGGTGIKGALVDVSTGEITSEHVRILTPNPATPDAVAAVAAAVAAKVCGTRRLGVGVGFPGVILGGTVQMACHLHKDWIGADAVGTFEAALGRPVSLVNDADAAGVAEARFGVAAGRKGTVVLVTIGTGLGTAVLVDGRLVPNTELGHLEVDGADAELIASESARIDNDWSWKRYAKGLQRYLETVQRLLWPELIVLGGGGSKKHERFIPLLDLPCEVVPATMGNEAGIVGAALAAGPPKRRARTA